MRACIPLLDTTRGGRDVAGGPSSPRLARAPEAGRNERGHALRLRFLRLNFLADSRYTALRVVAYIHLALNPFHCSVSGNDIGVGRIEHRL